MIPNKVSDKIIELLPDCDLVPIAETKNHLFLIHDMKNEKFVKMVVEPIPKVGACHKNGSYELERIEMINDAI